MRSQECVGGVVFYSTIAEVNASLEPPEYLLVSAHKHDTLVVGFGKQTLAVYWLSGFGQVIKLS